MMNTQQTLQAPFATARVYDFCSSIVSTILHHIECGWPVIRRHKAPRTRLALNTHPEQQDSDSQSTSRTVPLICKPEMYMSSVDSVSHKCRSSIAAVEAHIRSPKAWNKGVWIKEASREPVPTEQPSRPLLYPTNSPPIHHPRPSHERRTPPKPHPSINVDPIICLHQPLLTFTNTIY